MLVDAQLKIVITLSVSTAETFTLLKSNVSRSVWDAFSTES